MTPADLIDWNHPIITDDRLFFRRNPARRYRAREFGESESIVPMFTTDELGALREVNLVIVKRITGGRVRRVFCTRLAKRLCSDRAIMAFLRSRGIKPSMFSHDVQS